MDYIQTEIQELKQKFDAEEKELKRIYYDYFNGLSKLFISIFSDDELSLDEKVEKFNSHYEYRIQSLKNIADEFQEERFEPILEEIRNLQEMEIEQLSKLQK